MLYTVKNGNMEISADTFGAELHSIKLNGKEYLWQCGDAWKRYAPVLFPFVCSPKDRTYLAKGKEYKMLANHGFARDSEFEFLEQTENSISFSLTDNEKTFSQYPYHFTLVVKYTIEGDSVKVENFVKNKNSDEMYFYIGAHPAFKCPLNDGESFDDYYVEYSDDESYSKQIGGIKNAFAENGKVLNITRKLFDDDAIIVDLPNSKSVSLKNRKGNNSVTVKFPMSDCIAVWSPTADDNAEFVCLEPWSSVPTYCDDDFENLENKPHAVSLLPNEEYRYYYSIEVK